MSLIGGLLAGAGIGAGLNAVGGLFNSAVGAVGNGISNLISGGTWKQSGNQVAQNEFNAQQAELARNFEAEQAVLNRNFQAEQATTAWDRQMQASNTAITRQVNDMRKAGINPAMAFAGGGANGASTPSASMGSGSQARSSTAHSTAMSSMRTNVSDFTNSVANLARTFNYDKNTKNDINLGRAVATVGRIAGMLK